MHLEIYAIRHLLLFKSSSSSSVDQGIVDCRSSPAGSFWVVHTLSSAETCLFGPIHSWTWLEKDLCGLPGVPGVVGVGGSYKA